MRPFALMGVGAPPRARLDQVARWLGGTVPPEDAQRSCRGLSTDSRRVVNGDLFFAVPGCDSDGLSYVDAAVRAGAAAVVAPLGARSGALSRVDVPVLEVADVRAAKAIVAQTFYAEPSEIVQCVGITGTNGKTTTATMLHSILEVAGQRPALIGTIEQRLPGREPRVASHTTPDAIELARLLWDTARAGGRAAVLEVSSHALTQRRCDQIRFRAGVFTQLSREHLDYHGTVEEYRDAKAQLFQGLDAEATAVVNAEDPCAVRYLAATRARALTYGLAPGVDLRGRVRRMDIDGLCFDLVQRRGEDRTVSMRLVGRHNLMNALAAAGAALSLGVSTEAIAGGLESLQRVPGRLEPVDRGQDFRVLIDYAHTDDALEKVLHVLRPLTRGRLITVFGCGGNRDRAKRPRMGRVASILADWTIVTSDNPRSEDPAAIAAEVLAGVPGGGQTEVVLDRRAAIERALAGARGGDIVLVAGKGHERVQVTCDGPEPFDDRAVVEECLWRRSS